MTKFATQTMKPKVRTPFATTSPRRNHEGGLGVGRDAKSELFLLAISNMVSEDTAYESGSARDTRYEDLVHTVTREDPEWVAALVPWLRSSANMRSVAVVTAAEYVAAGGPLGRSVVSSALQRADEPAEMLAYWISRHGRSIPKPVKRGVADASAHLYNQHSLLKYDGSGKAFRFGDVIDLVHPTPKTSLQGELFKHALDRRHNHDELTRNESSLEVLLADAELLEIPSEKRRAFLNSDLFNTAGWTWERLSGWSPGGMDKDAWEAVIPNMGSMALARNLRNFDQAGVSDEVAFAVASKISDPEEIVKSRQFPMRYYSAYREAPSLRWAPALEKALDLSLQNVPSLDGRTAILIDVSGSMTTGLSARSQRQRWEVASIFGVALAKRAQNADLFLFDTSIQQIDFKAPLLRMVDGIRSHVGGGTYLHQAILSAYNGHDRVVCITDEQAQDAGRVPLDQVPLLYTFNVAGYKTAHTTEGPGRYSFGGGLSDACFTMLATLESMRSGKWPHLTSN